MKRTISLLTAVFMLLTITNINFYALASGDIAIDAQNFPDSVWRDYVSAHFDTDSDGYLSKQEAEAVTNISVSSMSITDLTGIAYFPNLEALDCYRNDLETLDFSNNTALKSLSCFENNLTALDISNNTALEYLDCSKNRLSTLDVNNNFALQWLYCYNNLITILDITNNPDLETLYCHNNQLTSLDVSNQTSLKNLDCANNNIDALNLNNNLLLEYISCNMNQLTSISFNTVAELISLSCAVNPITSLDLSSAENLELLDCSYNLLISLDISHNGKLSSLSCTGNKLTELNTNNNPLLSFLECNNNSFTTLDITNNTQLSFLDCRSTQLTELDVSNNLLLYSLDCRANYLTDLDLSNQVNLQTLRCSFNQLPALDLSTNNALSELDAGSQIPVFDLEEQNGEYYFIITNSSYSPSRVSSLSSGTATTTGIKFDSINDIPSSFSYSYDTNWSNGSNKLEVTVAQTDLLAVNAANFPDNAWRAYVLNSFDLDNDSSLSQQEILTVTAINVASESITDLTGIEYFTNLQFLSCYNNDISSLDFSDNPALFILFCQNNELISLDISNNTNLVGVNCSNNLLTGEDFSNNLQLSYLLCLNNKFSTLDVSANTGLQIFKAGTQTPTLELQYENGTYFVELSGPNYSPSHVSNLSAGTATAAGIEFASLQDVPQTLTYSYNIDWAYGTEYMEVTATIDSGIPQNPVPINETTFPDTIWRDYVTANFDADSDGYLSEQEAEAVTIVEVDSMSITDLTGIAYFTNLTVLYCGANLLTSLDISGNTALTELYASFNRLTSLDVSNNTALTLLECDINYLTSLDVSNNTALTSLYCSFNRLDALDISSNTILRNLDCSGNFLTELDLSANTDLQALRCHSNFLTELDLSNITDLNELFCSGNRLTELDVSGFPNLTYLLCTNNYLSALDVSANTNLYDSLDAGSQYPTYDITEINGAYYFEITDSGYSPSRVSNLSAGTATATGIRFDSLNDVPDSFTYSYDPEWSEEPVIIDVTVTNEGLIAIDAQNFPDNVCRAGVTLFDANSDGFLSLQERATITSMAPSNLPISDLTGIEYFPNLQMLFGYDDALTFLDLSSNTKLLAILCQNNQLATLDFSNNPDVILFMTSPQTPTLELQYENGTYFVELPGPNYSPSRVSNLSAGTATAAGIEFASLQDVPETLTYSYDIDWAYGTEYMEVTATIDDNIPQSPVPINATTFPDAIWRAYVAANYDTDSDGYLSSYERLVVSSVDVSAMGIEDLTGIVYFSNLDRLECYENALTALDISGNGALTFLDCSYNELAALDISGNTALETLNYSYNDLPAVDLSNNTALLMFACMGNGITSFDPSILPNLKYLAIAQNPIGSLDISSNQDLEVLLAVENNLTSLDVSNNLLLETLFISSNNFTAIDVSQNTNLLWLNCASNPITELDLSNNTALTSLNCPYNALATLDLSANPNLTTIFLTVQDQQTTLPLQYENGEYFIALPGINYSPTRVLVLSAGTATAAGIVFDSLDDVPDTLTYSYNTQHPSKTLLMNVTVTVDKSAF